jgi:RNA polymerase sigma factor (sigma-70 family)
MRKLKDNGKEDIKLIKLIKSKNCDDSFDRLRERHSNLFYSMCNKFSNQIDLDEIYKDKDFVMYKAAMSFNEDKGAKFSTWLGNYSRYHCLNYIKNNFKYVCSGEDKITHFYNTKSIDNYNHQKNHKDDLDHAFSILEKMSDKRIFRIFKLRYLYEGPKLTWKQIAEKFDLTPQTIINLHAKGRRVLKRKMKKNTFSS